AQLRNAGKYYLTTTANGCTHLDSVTVIINCVPVTKPTVSASICAGSTYTFYGRTLTVAGTYTDTLHTAGACDSVRVLSLTVNNPFGGAGLPVSDASNFGSAQVYNGHTYYVSVGQRTWNNAKVYAESLGGHLATISNAGENSFISSIRHSTVSVWIGGTDELQEGVWKWTTGEPFTYTNWDCINWGFCQPDNNAPGGQNYSLLVLDGTWDDGADGEGNFIVEFDQTAFTATSNSPISVGQTLNLTATTLTGATYAWRGPNSFASNQQNPSIANAQLRNAGKYYLTTTANGCTHLDSVTVIINCVPVTKPTVSASICAGSTYTFYGRTLTVAGTYTDTLHTAGACDSVRVLSLTVNDPFGSMPASLSNGLVAYYPFNGNANDLSGNSNNANASAFAFALDKNNNADNAISFNGSQSLEIPDSPNLSPANITISFWFNTSDASANQFLMAKSNFGYPGSMSYKISYNDPFAGPGPIIPNTVSVGFVTQNCLSHPFEQGFNIYSSIPLTGNTWNHVLVTYDGNAGKIFINGVQDINASTGHFRDTYAPNVQTGPVVYCPGSPLGLGRWWISDARYLKGSLDELRIYNRALNSNEALALYSTFTASSNSPLPVGDTLKLSATTLTGAAYAWGGPNSFTSTQQNPSIANAQLRHAGKYYLTTTANGCTHQDTVTVVLNCVPVNKPTVSASICAGSTYTFYGRTLTTSGTYTDTMHTAGACDSVRVLSLTVNNPFGGAVALPASATGNFGRAYVFNGHTYYMSNLLKTWEDANSFANSLGGHLVTITSAAENRFIYDSITQSNTWIWMGATDKAQAGTWQWVTGEPFTYTDWLNQEPSGGLIERY
ncbi:MAG: lectin-like protein, partial [Bacteroidota bacterium]